MAMHRHVGFETFQMVASYRMLEHSRIVVVGVLPKRLTGKRCGSVVAVGLNCVAVVGLSAAARSTDVMDSSWGKRVAVASREVRAMVSQATGAWPVASGHGQCGAKATAGAT